MLRRAVTEIEDARLGLDCTRLAAQHFVDRGTSAPERGRLGARGRRQVFAERLENLSDKAVRRPVRQTDLAAPLADAAKFGSRLPLVWCKHDSEGGDDRIEGGIFERKRFRVGLLEFDRKAVGRCARPPAFEQGRYIVAGRHLAPSAGRCETGHSVTGGHVQDFAAGTKVERLAKLLPDDLQGCADDGIIARRPRRLLPALDGSKVGRGGLSRSGRARHVFSPVRDSQGGYAAVNQLWSREHLKSLRRA